MLETIFLEILEAEDIENVDFFKGFRGIIRSQTKLYFVKNELKDGVIYGLAKGMKIGDAVLFVVRTQCILLQEFLTLV